jgi:2-polyprenyl-3-methyl-5-hydroxy-6-metoxy-1,4-benzoquinol methylase
MIGAQRSADWYDRKFSSTSKYRSAYNDAPYYFLWTVIADRLRRDNLTRVLEIGCGSGQLAALLFDQAIETYTGLDFSPTAVEYAREAAPGGRFVVGDARSSTLYREVEHDVLICTEVLEHIEEDLAVLSNFRSGVRCMFSVPNYTSESHVRFFPDASAVVARYGRFFDALDITAFPTAGSKKNRLFLADGHRNALRG